MLRTWAEWGSVPRDRRRHPALGALPLLRTHTSVPAKARRRSLCPRIEATAYPRGLLARGCRPSDAGRPAQHCPRLRRLPRDGAVGATGRRPGGTTRIAAWVTVQVTDRDGQLPRARLLRLPPRWPTECPAGASRCQLDLPRTAQPAVALTTSGATAPRECQVSTID